MEKRAEDKPREGIRQITSLGRGWNGKKGRGQAQRRDKAEDKPREGLEGKKWQRTSPEIRYDTSNLFRQFSSHTSITHFVFSL